MEKKSGRKFRLNKSLPYPASRNLDNFMITADEKEIEKIKKHCVKHGVKLETIGVVE
jgi:selenophosphate synthetase-related protein